MNTLTARDLNTELDTEPRILDVTLGARLGMAQPLNIRGKIRDNFSEISRFGRVLTVSVKTSPSGGRPSTAYYLNEAQAILICMFSNTPNAADVRQQVITVFMAHRYGRLASSVQAPGVDPLPRLEQILDTHERSLKLETAVAMVDDLRRRNDAHSTEMARTVSGIRHMLAGPAVQPIGQHGIRRAVDARDRRRLGLELIAAGHNPDSVAVELGVNVMTARRWAQMAPHNDN